MQRGHRGVMVLKPEGLYCHHSSSRETQVHPREDGCPSAADSSREARAEGNPGQGRGWRWGWGNRKPPAQAFVPPPVGLPTQAPVCCNAEASGSR